METAYSMHGREQKCVQSFSLKNEDTYSVCVTVSSTELWCNE
jgi:hypothetical protein